MMLPRGTSDATPYERALVMQNLGFVYGATERYQQAIQQFEQALEIDALSHRETQDMFRMLGSMYAVEERWDRTLQVMRRYFYWEDNPPADSLLLMAQAHAAREEFRDGIVWVRRLLRGQFGCKTPTDNLSALCLTAKIRVQPIV
jgi:tetratricopeptide (TPR) repeat protein